MTDEQKRWIDKATLHQLLGKWRFAPVGDPLVRGEVGEYFSKVMAEKRSADPSGWTQASKALGWDNLYGKD